LNGSEKECLNKNPALYPNDFAHFQSKCPKYPYVT